MAPKSKQGLIPVPTLQDAFEREPAHFEVTLHRQRRIKNAIGRPRTRPRVTDPGVLQAICERLIMGHGLVSILKDPKLPSLRDAYRELAANPRGEFASGIAYARELAHHAIMDHCTHLVENMTEENAQMTKIKLDWYKWHQARLHPGMYGDKVQQDITVRNEKPVNLTREEFTDIAYRIVEDV